MAATVTARGVAVAPATPDEGIWIVTMSALDASPDAALEEVGSRSAELQALLGELDVPSEKRSSSGVSVREEYEWDEGKRTHGGYLASNSVTVRLEDPAVAGRLIQGRDRPREGERARAGVVDRPEQRRPHRGMPAGDAGGPAQG